MWKMIGILLLVQIFCEISRFVALAEFPNSRKQAMNNEKAVNNSELLQRSEKENDRTNQHKIDVIFRTKLRHFVIGSAAKVTAAIAP